MLTIKYDGAEYSFDAPVTVYDAVSAAGPVSRDNIAAKVDGEVVGMTHLIEADAEVSLLTFADADGAKVFRHTASHILAQAVKTLYPHAKLTIGPAIDDGFYYDFDIEPALTPDDLPKIEAEMKKIVKANYKIERFTLPREEAIAFMEEKEEPYKVELIRDLPEDAVISFYRQGDFVDLCAGPHLFTTGAVKAYKLTACTGAYWRGKSDNKMLCRVYGTAFPAKDALNAHLAQIEEARKRDHNKIGRELGYFTTVDTVGQGLPIMLPKGSRVIQLLQRWIEDEEQKRGYLLTKTPLMGKREFFKISGHWDHYLDGMFVIGDPYDETKECFALRPM
ncbi:MAG: threonine--tRNA ligase, partial [Clostridia bacterium]|nr:threonine--tRNA ligase [Clostridia bacterium]